MQWLPKPAVCSHFLAKAETYKNRITGRATEPIASVCSCQLQQIELPVSPWLLRSPNDFAAARTRLAIGCRQVEPSHGRRNYKSPSARHIDVNRRTYTDTVPVRSCSMSHLCHRRRCTSSAERCTWFHARLQSSEYTCTGVCREDFTNFTSTRRVHNSRPSTVSRCERRPSASDRQRIPHTADLTRSSSQFHTPSSNRRLAATSYLLYF
jgi:hypothetical protein